jgi:hypothetical protein
MELIKRNRHDDYSIMKIECYIKSNKGLQVKKETHISEGGFYYLTNIYTKDILKIY